MKTPAHTPTPWKAEYRHDMKPIISKSLDPSWVLWAVSMKGQDTLWFYSETTARIYAQAVTDGDRARADEIALAGAKE
jgi:hypothetical protein